MKKNQKQIKQVMLVVCLLGLGIILSIGITKTKPQRKTDNTVITATPIVEPTNTPTPTLQENKEKVTVSNAITATGIYDYSGTRTNISIQFSESGGRITGNVIDECNGSVTGVYDGKESISGDVTGTCKILNNNLNSHASYGGTVYKNQKKIVINFKGTSESYFHQGTVTLYFK